MTGKEKYMKREDMLKWNVATTSEYGMQEAVAPGKQECEYTHINRLNLKAGDSWTLESGENEMFLSLISGSGMARAEGAFEEKLKKLDCCYLKAETVCVLKAEEDCTFYIAFAKYEGTGETCYIKFDPDTPLGPMHEVHGEGVFRREVFLMVGDKTPASRFMCGYTFGPEAGWTSWPPHEHTDTLEETYCYFDMPEPNLGYQYTYLEENGFYDAVAHPVREGNMVVFPAGYHPTVASPGTRNNYLWVLVARKPEYRVFNVYNQDPNYVQKQQKEQR